GPAANAANGAQFGNHGLVVHISPRGGTYLFFSKVCRQILNVFNFALGQSKRTQFVMFELEHAAWSGLAPAGLGEAQPYCIGRLDRNLMPNNSASQSNERRG